MTGAATPTIQEQYFSALGEFIHCFSELELVLNYAVADYLGIDKEKFIAVFSALRVDHSSEHLRKIISLNPNNYKYKEMSIMLDQIAIIQDVRNRLVHFGPTAFGPSEKLTKRRLQITNKGFVTESRKRERDKYHNR